MYFGVFLFYACVCVQVCVYMWCVYVCVCVCVYVEWVVVGDGVDLCWGGSICRGMCSRICKGGVCIGRVGCSVSGRCRVVVNIGCLWCTVC